MRRDVSVHLTRKQLAGLLTGNIIEYYDYVVYGLMTPVLSTLFFPSDNRLLSLIQTYAAFATAMMVRPLGALLLGVTGDLVGRRKTLLISCFVTGAGTLGIGCLPDASTIGILAPCLLVAMHVLQSFGMSAEFCSVLVLTGEMSQPAKRGFITSLVHGSAMSGTLLASLVIAAVFLLPNDHLYSWGWRLPFWLGGLICLNAWLLRKRLPPQPAERPGINLKKEIGRNGSGLFRMFLIVAGNTLVYHLFFVFCSTRMIEMLNIPPKTAMLMNSINLIGLTLCCALGGWLGDRFGRRKVYLASIFATTVLSIPAYILMSPGSSWLLCMAGQALFALVGGLLLGVSSALYTEILPEGIRMTGTAVPYNLAIVIFGGTAPLAAITLTEWTGLSFAPGIYLALAGIVITVSMYGIRDKTGKSIN